MFNFPSSPTAGQIYTDSATGAQYIFQNSVWRQVSAAQIKLTASDQNTLVNGGFQISQENGTTVVSANAAYPADQWLMTINGAFSAAAQQAYSAAYGRYAISAQNGAVLASPAAGDFFIPDYQYIEGTRMFPLRWGTPQAIPAVLNFKMAVNRDGTYGAVIKSPTADRAIGFDLPITAAEGLKEFTFAIPAQTGGTWPFGAALGAICGFSHTLGSASKAAVHGVWQNSNCNGGPGMTVNSAVAGTNMQIYDAQLLPDPLGTGIAPPFVPKSYAADLLECQRYWRRLDRPMLYLGSVASITLMYVGMPYSPSMRAVPTPSAMALANSAYSPGGGSVAATSGSYVALTVDSGYFIVGVSTGMSGIAATAQAVTLNARM